MAKMFGHAGPWKSICQLPLSWAAFKKTDNLVSLKDIGIFCVLNVDFNRKSYCLQLIN